MLVIRRGGIRYFLLIFVLESCQIHPQTSFFRDVGTKLGIFKHFWGGWVGEYAQIEAQLGSSLILCFQTYFSEKII